MKHLLMLMLFAAITTGVNAQTTDGAKSGSTQKRTKITKREKKRLQRGTGQYYGSRDTTPGSPMGTGGAGGDNMSGSQAASAIETAARSDSADAQSDSTDRVNQSTNNTPNS